MTVATAVVRTPAETGWHRHSDVAAAVDDDDKCTEQDGADARGRLNRRTDGRWRQGRTEEAGTNGRVLGTGSALGRPATETRSAPPGGMPSSPAPALPVVPRTTTADSRGHVEPAGSLPTCSGGRWSSRRPGTASEGTATDGGRGRETPTARARRRRSQSSGEGRPGVTAAIEVEAVTDHPRCRYTGGLEESRRSTTDR